MPHLNDKSWLNNIHDLATLPNVLEHSFLSENATSSWFDRQNSKKCRHFWLIRSFKNKFSTFLNDPACGPNVLEHSFLSDYAISSWPERPNSKKWPKQVILYQRYVIIEWFRCRTCMVPLLNRKHHLGQSKYAIWSWTGRPN